MWALQRIVLQWPPWFPVVSSQLAVLAFSKLVPGGTAPAAALQAQMLAGAGVPAATIGTGLTAGALLLVTAPAGLPLLALPAVLLGRHIPDGLLQTAAIGLALVLTLFLGLTPKLAIYTPDSASDHDSRRGAQVLVAVGALSSGW